MEENIVEFELNNKVLNDFDSLMNMHLDQIETLVITSISNNSKFYNIISLCSNLKTLKIKGDLKINTNNIISNIFNPSMLECIVFEGVKLPNLKSFSKFNNLKSIVLRNIKYSSIKGFISLVDKTNVESLCFENTDFCRASISIVSDFKKLKYLEIKNCDNCKFDDYSFLAQNRYLDKVVLEPVNISFDNLQYFTKGKAIKCVKGTLGKTTKKSLVNRIIFDENEISVLINSMKLKELSENINFNRIDKMVLNLNKDANLVGLMKLLKRVKKEIIVSVKNLSYLSVQDAILLKDGLNVKKIKVVDLEDNYAVNINDVYDIDNYIEIRKRVDDFIKAVVAEDENPLEKIIKVYKSIIYSETREILDSGSNNKNQLNNIISHVYTDYSFAELFSNCLACLNMEVKTVRGQDNAGKTRFWNQVKIYENWYNLDLFLDAKNQSDKKSSSKKHKYLLLSDKEFNKDHKAKSTNYEHCLYSIDKKIINKYFKEEKFNINWITGLLKKIKQIFLFNENKANSLPAPVTAKQIDNTKYSDEEIDLINKIDELD